MNQTKEKTPSYGERPHSLDIPKSAEIFRGDINDAVIRVQQETGVVIDDSWWFSKVGNGGTTESILDRFDDAYAEKMLDQQETSNSDTSHEVKDVKAIEAQKEEFAWEYYTPVDSEEYEKANNERAQRGKIKIVRISGNRPVTLVASIKVDPETGEAISGHEYNPEAESMHDIEMIFHDYLEDTNEDERILIYEGDERIHENRDESIQKATDSGLVQHLASREKLPAVSGEPTDQETLAFMEQLGVTPEELLAFYVVRGLESELSGPNADFLAGYIHFQAAKLGVEGFEEYSEAKKQSIIEEGKLDEIRAELVDKVKPILPKLNDLYRSSLGGKDLFVIKNGEVKINPELADDIEKISMETLNWSGDNRINEVAKLNMEMRDRVLFHRIIEAERNGKKPLVIYGGSHMIALEPALKAYSGT